MKSKKRNILKNADCNAKIGVDTPENLTKIFFGRCSRLFDPLQASCRFDWLRLLSSRWFEWDNEAGPAATWGAQSRPRLRPGHGLTDEITVAIPILWQRDLHGRTHSMVAFDYPMGRGIWDLRCRRSSRISLRSHRMFSRNQLFDCPDLNCTTCAGIDRKRNMPKRINIWNVFLNISKDWQHGLESQTLKDQYLDK